MYPISAKDCVFYYRQCLTIIYGKMVPIYSSVWLISCNTVTASLSCSWLLVSSNLRLVSISLPTLSLLHVDLSPVASLSTGGLETSESLFEVSEASSSCPGSLEVFRTPGTGSTLFLAHHFCLTLAHHLCLTSLFPCLS